MADRLPAELLNRVFGRLPLPDLLVWMRVSRRFYALIRRSTDWDWERRRVGVRGDYGGYWYGRRLSMGRTDEDQALGAAENSAYPGAEVDVALELEQELEQLPGGAERLLIGAEPVHSVTDALAELGRTLALERELSALPEPGPGRRELGIQLNLHSSQFNGQLYTKPHSGTSVLEDPRLFSPQLLQLCPGGTKMHQRFLPDHRHLVLLNRRPTLTVHLLDVRDLTTVCSRDIGLVDPSVFANCYIYEDRLCFVLDSGTALVLQLPDLRLLHVAQLGTEMHIGSDLLTGSFFFFGRTSTAPNWLMAFDVRTARPYREFPLPDRVRSFCLSTDRRHVVVLAEHSLHLFDMQAEDDPLACRPATLLEVAPLKAFKPSSVLRLHWRDGHVLVVPQHAGGLCVLDRRLRLLYRVQVSYSSTIYFVGEHLFVNSAGQVYDWRRRRRYLGTIYYSILLRLNRQWVHGREVQVFSEPAEPALTSGTAMAVRVWLVHEGDEQKRLVNMHKRSCIIL